MSNGFSTLACVRQFHETFGLKVSDEVTLDDEQVNKLRIDLIQEELDELKEAIEAKDEVAVLDALTDLQYVLDGAYVDLGFGLFKNAAFIEVHHSNMSKLDEAGNVIKNDAGKVQKSDQFQEPRLGMVMEQMRTLWDKIVKEREQLLLDLENEEGDVTDGQSTPTN